MACTDATDSTVPVSGSVSLASTAMAVAVSSSVAAASALATGASLAPERVMETRAVASCPKESRTV